MDTNETPAAPDPAPLADLPHAELIQRCHWALVRVAQHNIEISQGLLRNSWALMVLFFGTGWMVALSLIPLLPGLWLWLAPVLPSLAALTFSAMELRDIRRKQRGDYGRADLDALQAEMLRRLTGGDTRH